MSENDFDNQFCLTCGTPRDFSVTDLEAENASLREQLEVAYKERDGWRFNHDTLSEKAIEDIRALRQQVQSLREAIESMSEMAGRLGSACDVLDDMGFFRIKETALE